MKVKIPTKEFRHKNICDEDYMNQLLDKYKQDHILETLNMDIDSELCLVKRYKCNKCDMHFVVSASRQYGGYYIMVGDEKAVRVNYVIGCKEAIIKRILD